MKRKNRQIRSFDFSEIGEEEQIIINPEPSEDSKDSSTGSFESKPEASEGLEAPPSREQMKRERKEKPKKESKVEENQKGEEAKQNKLGYIPIKFTVKQADRVSELKEEGYLTIEEVEKKFQEELNGKFESGIWLSTESYLTSAFKYLDIVGGLEKRIDVTRFSSQMVSSLSIAITWLKSIKSDIEMARDIAIANEERTGKFPLDLNVLMSFMDLVISQRERRMMNLKKSLKCGMTA